MATKTVTLKDSNGDTLYPVTDSNVVNINQQKTLAQALDGVVYAEDPTAPANPNAWITNSDIDWSTMPGSYSTTEQKTPFTWIDGKPIYKKSVDFGALPNNTTKHVNHGISNFGRLVRIEGSAGVNGNWTMMPLVFQGNQSNYNTEFQVTSTYIHMSANTDRSSWRDCIVTLWYTKTTD